MRKNVFVGLFVFIYCLCANAEIKVAFFKIYDYHGRLIQLEPQGRFAHLAISYQNGWLHSRPLKGVEWVQDLHQIGGVVAEILVNSKAPALDPEQVKPYWGQPYDSHFSWRNDTAVYCSKLVGKLLGLSPSVMEFRAPIWQGMKNLPRGELGFSPDDVYISLRKRNYRPEGENCAGLLGS